MKSSVQDRILLKVSIVKSIIYGKKDVRNRNEKGGFLRGRNAYGKIVLGK